MPLVRCRSTIYAGDMRYPDGGGLAPAARGRGETVRMQAARLFAEDVAPVQVAARLRVSTKSAYQWRRRWRGRGRPAPAPPPARAGRGRPGAGLHRAGRGQLSAVRRPAGPAAHRAGARAGRARLGRSAVDPGPGLDADPPAVPRPVRPARDRVSAAPPGLVGAAAPTPRGRARRGRDRRVAHPDLGEGTRLAASTGAWIVFEDEAGATLRPPKARTWAARGHTPVVA